MEETWPFQLNERDAVEGMKKLKGSSCSLIGARLTELETRLNYPYMRVYSMNSERSLPFLGRLLSIQRRR